MLVGVITQQKNVHSEWVFFFSQKTFLNFKILVSERLFHFGQHQETRDSNQTDLKQCYLGSGFIRRVRFKFTSVSLSLLYYPIKKRQNLDCLRACRFLAETKMNAASGNKNEKTCWYTRMCIRVFVVLHRNLIWTKHPSIVGKNVNEYNSWFQFWNIHPLFYHILHSLNYK
jgi:hypothetical protein